MFPIIKIWHKENNINVKHIYVFLNNKWIVNSENTIAELNEAFKIQNREKFIKHGIFTDSELNIVFGKNIPVTFIPHPIHIDDTIRTIKQKIIEKTNLRISLPEIYLFGVKRAKLNSSSIYSQLTQEGELILTRDRLIQFLKNYVHFNIKKFDKLEDKEFTEADIVPFTETIEEIKFTLGQKFIATGQPISFTTDPFDTIVIDDILKDSSHITSTENENYLLEYQHLVNNNIYLCTAKDVLHVAKKSGNEKMMIKLYFPLLQSKKIQVNTLQELNDKKEDLLEMNQEGLDKNFTQYNDNINLFYNLFFSRDIEIKPIKQGIKSLHFVIHPINIINFPLEIIFKLIHATPSHPFIKLNRGKRRENIYRLYAPEISRDGKKIPKLSKSTILKLRRSIGHTKSVSLAIQNFLGEYIFCEFLNNGDLKIRLALREIQDKESVETIIQQSINPLLEKIQEYMSQSGYEYFLFKTLHATNVEIIDINYVYNIVAQKKALVKNIKQLNNCLGTIFNIYYGKTANDINLRFKRVAHFNNMDSIDAFITTLFKQGLTPTIIINKLQLNFKLGPEEATLKYAGWVGENQVRRGQYENIKVKIINNPGFPIDLYWNTDMLTLEISEIDNISYLTTLPLYLNSFVKMTQYKKLTKGNTKEKITREIEKICNQKQSEVKKVFDDIKSSSEKNLSDQDGQVNIVDGKVVINKEDIDNDILDLFGGDDDDDDDDAEYSDDDDYSSSASPSPFTLASKKSATITSTTIPKSTSTPKSTSSSKASTSVESIEEKEIDGLKLTNPNYFQKEMENLDHILFIKKKEGRFAQYSRTCPVNLRRQPVILTDEQFKTIREKTPKAIKSAVKYGSTPDKRYWYICPQYWCLKTDEPLSKEDLDNAKKKNIKLCGDNTNPYNNIIPFKAREVPKGKYIYSFVDAPQIDKGQYKITEHPGFFANKHPNQDLCIPCCFNIPNSSKQMKLREQCGAEAWSPGMKRLTAKPSISKSKKTNVIKEGNKFPINAGNWGHLPYSLYRFLEIPRGSFECNDDGNICILRKGVEYNPKQSFIAAMSNIYSTDPTPPSIQEMKEIIIEALTLDNFITLQHGTLVELFKTNKETKKIAPYKNTIVYKKLIHNEIGKTYLKQIISAFHNFQSYLRDDTNEIDYEYLWDIFSTPNPKLFPRGINLIIFDVLNNDITQNIAVTCPTNHYSKALWSANKKNALILHKDGFFEPIFKRTKKSKNEIIIDRLFALQGTAGEQYPWSLQAIVRKIGNTTKKKCLPLTSQREQRQEFASRPRVNRREPFVMKNNINFKELEKRLRKTKYNITKQIVNLFTKVIGVMVDNGDDEVFVPIKPSPIIMDTPWSFAESDTSWWNDYDTTLRMLQNISQLEHAKGKIPCKPTLKVVDDGKVIGIITRTDQLVPTHPKTLEDTLTDSLIPYHINIDIPKSNKIIWESTKEDSERLESVQKIKLETNFYNTFRNMIRILLNQYKFSEIRTNIEQTLHNTEISYWKKLQQIIDYLKLLLKDFLEFVDYGRMNIDTITSISLCLNLDKKSCPENPTCLSESEGNCKLLIPSKNLLSNNDNELIYYGRMADELIRYGHIRSFIFEPRKFISFQEIGYNLKENEMLLLESMLLAEHDNYFKNLTPITENKYVKYPQTFYNAEPRESIPYTNKTEFI